MHLSSNWSSLLLMSQVVMVKTNLKTVVIIHFAITSTIIATAWFALMTVFTHATTEHTKMSGGSSATPALSKLVQKHHVCNNQYLDEHIVVPHIIINDNKLLLFYLNEQVDKLFKQWHQVGFVDITCCSRHVQITRLIHVVLMSHGLLLRFKAAVAFLRPTQRHKFSF